MPRPLDLTQTENTLLQEFKNTLKREFPQEILEFWLFGSKAQGKGGAESDLDVLIISQSDDYHLSDKIVDIATQLMLKYDLYISPKVISKEHYKKLEKMDSDFLYFVKMDRIPL